MRNWTIGQCTPIPMSPVNPEGFARGEDMRKCRGKITPEWHRAIKRVVAPPGYGVTDIIEDGLEVGVARCEAVKAARAANMRYLFFVDWDVIVPPDALVRLVWQLENNPEYDVASGMYVLKSFPTWPLLWRDWSVGVSFDWTYGEVLKERVVGVPMGCALLRLSLFDKLDGEKVPWFKTLDETVLLEPGVWVEQRMTEDLFFCKRFTEEVGGKILVDTGLLCPHICHETGMQFVMHPDSLPMRRARECQPS